MEAPTLQWESRYHGRARADLSSARCGEYWTQTLCTFSDSLDSLLLCLSVGVSSSPCYPSTSGLASNATVGNGRWKPMGQMNSLILPSADCSEVRFLLAYLLDKSMHRPAGCVSLQLTEKQHPASNALNCFVTFIFPLLHFLCLPHRPGTASAKQSVSSFILALGYVF